jgi:hypothetical protein
VRCSTNIRIIKSRRLGWAGTCSMHSRDDKYTYKISRDETTSEMWTQRGNNKNIDFKEKKKV